MKIVIIEYCFALVGPEFDQFEHPLLLEDSTPKPLYNIQWILFQILLTTLFRTP